ncbi:Zinc finger protein PLAG1 like [Verticillium longisporum]|nr:Zinc finger protein PLAG1 like [Verticillium longisporum]
METHDDKREYPFPCQIGDCNKRFVRKTDLQRHHQSVHTKERNHKCDYCSRLFARKDTLRRHMEDGCSRRFDLGTLDLRSEGYNSSSSSRRQLPGTSTATTEYGVPSHGTLPPLLIGPAGEEDSPPVRLAGPLALLAKGP